MECEICGCTDTHACIDPTTRRPCHWIAEGLCSACEFAPLAFRAPEPDQRQPNAPGYVLEAAYRGGNRHPAGYRLAPYKIARGDRL